MHAWCAMLEWCVQLSTTAVLEPGVQGNVILLGESLL